MRKKLILALSVSLVLAGPGVFGQDKPTPNAERHEFVIMNFKTESGVTLPQARVVYGTYGNLNDAKDNGAVSTDILHFRARVLGVYGQGLFHGQPLTPETVSAVPSSDRMVRFSRPSPPTHTGPRGLRSQGTVSSQWSRDCVE